jgi:hypothetical protein
MTVLAAAVLLAHAAAAQPAAESTGALKQIGAFEEASGEKLIATMTVEQCVRDAKCWGLVKTMFGRQFGIARTKVDGALPGQFFPDTTTFSLRAAVKGTGHYLYVLCGRDLKKRRPCADKRDLLEKRVFEYAMALALPGGGRPEDLADLETLKVTPQGKLLISRAEGARRGFRQELLDLAVSSLGVEENPVPRALR